MSWNPNNTCMLGLEWFPTIESSVALDSDTAVAAMTLHSTATEDIEYVWVYVPSKRLSADGGWEIEIYDADATLASGSSTGVTFAPGKDVRRINAFGWGPHAPTGSEDPLNLWRAVDAASLTPGVWPNSGALTDHNEGIFPVYGSGFETSFLFNATMGALTGRRITRVSLVGVFNEYWWQDLPGGTTVRPYVTIDGRTSYGDSFRLTPGQLATVTGSFWSCPSTKASWKVADVEKLDVNVVSSYENGAGWQVGATRSANNLPIMHRTYLQVEHDGNEHRIATGVLTNPQLGWNRIPVHDIGTTNPWSKQNATNYLVTLRRTASPQGSISWRQLGSDQLRIHSWSLASVKLTDNGRVPTSYTDWAAMKNYAILLQEDGTGNIVDDSQPYASGMGDVEPQLGSMTDKTAVDSSHSVEQEITCASTDNYGHVRLLGRLKTTTSDGDLVVKIKRRSDNLQFGGTLQIPYTDLAVPRDQWQVIEGDLDPVAALVNTTQYYFEITSTASADLGWEVQVLSTMPDVYNGPPTGTDTATFNGTTDVPAFNTVDDNHRDVSIVVHTAPAAPTSFTVTPVDITCVDPYVSVTWDPTSIADCSLFMRYEIERSDDGVTWDRIAAITDESVNSFVDREARISVAQYYRMRVRRNDHSCSPYTATETTTIDPGCCGYWFSSNEAGTAAVWGDDAEPNRITKPINEPVTKTFYGRKYQVAFHELEWRGVSFTRKIMVAAAHALDGLSPTSTPGIATFDPILDAVTPARGATYSYVCVRNEDGDRWFASVTVKELEERQPAGWYLATVDIIEVTDVPSTPDEAAP